VATLAIGDIHGNINALDDLLTQIERELTPTDTVVFLGDYIDRGPSSKACVERLLEFRSSSDASVVTLLGNHEEWFLQTLRDPTRHSWLLGMEAFDTIASYSVDAAIELRGAAQEAGAALFTSRVPLPYDAFFASMPKTHIAFFESLVPSHRTSEAIYVHGGLDPGIPRFEDQPAKTLVWGTADFQQRYDGHETIVYGHWNNAVMAANGWWPQPRIVNRTVGIDTISHGVLTAYGLPDGRIVQSRRYPQPE
jgi:serine/threonine protein phosphatase 1